jgi:shikimate kinase
MTSVASRLDGRSVVLIGLMGAGKSSVGRRLAKALGLPFIDADEEVAKAAGCPIEDIFERFGEAAFRDGEERVIQRLLNDGPQVLATGGGAYMNARTRARIAERGVSVWLRADLDVLVRRTKGRRGRPLLKTEDPRPTLEKLMQERYPVYAGTDIVVDTNDEPHEVTVNKIISALDRFVSRDRQGSDASPARAVE